MTYDFINRNIIAGYIYYDLIISQGGFEDRVTVKVSEDTEEAKEAVAAEVISQIIARKEEEKLRGEIIDSVKGISSKIENFILNSDTSLEDLTALNTTFNQVAASLGLSLTAPDIKSLILLRIKDSINNVVKFFENSKVNTTTKEQVEAGIQAIENTLQ